MKGMMEEMKADLQKLSELPPQRRMLLVILIALLFALSILVGSYLLGGRASTQPTTSNSQQTTPTAPEGKTMLSISPSDQILTVGKTQRMTVALSNVAVSAADIILEFDPTAVLVSTIQNGNVFDRVIRNKVGAGTVTFSGAVAPEKKDQLKTGTVLTFTVTPLKAGSTVIAFDKKKTITAVGGVNTLGEAAGATLTIQ